MALFGCGRPAAERSAPRIRVFAQNHLSQGPLLIADAEGFFRDEGLEVELFSATSSKEGILPLVQGEIEVLTGSLKPALLAAIEKGARIRVVADKGHFAPAGCTYLGLVARPELLNGGELLPRPGGAPWRISYPRASLFEMLFQRVFAQEGLSSEQMDVFHLSGDNELQALVQERLDVGSTTGAKMQVLLDAGKIAIWKTAQQVWPNGQFSVVLFGSTLLDRDPEAGERFMTAYLKGVRQYNQGKTARNLELLAKRTGTPAADLESACWIPVRDDGRIQVDSLADLQRWAIEEGFLARELAVAEIWEPRFVEAAAARLAH